MTRSQSAATAGLLLLAMSMAVLIGVFDARRRVIAAEGNDLRTGESAWVVSTLAELQGAADVFEPGTKVFLDQEDGVRVVATLSGAWTDVPLHHGRVMSGARGEALVGAAVEAVGDEVVVAGTAYTIVGRLGVRPHSLLDDDVVLADPSLFTPSPQRLLLDGPDSARRYSARFPGRDVEVVDAGTNRRTNIDTVSPVLVTLGVLVVALVAVSAGAQAGVWGSRAAAVRFTTGVRRSSTFGVAVTTTTVLGLATSAVALVGSVTVQRLLFVDAPVVGHLVLVGTIAAVACGASSWWGSRRWSS